MDTSSSPADAPVVAVLGSARLGPDDPRWDAARALGAQFAAQGWTVVSGGYGGLMAAVAGGAREAGGRTVGLPMSGWRHLTPDAANDELRWSAGYAERIGHLLQADVAVALDGGVGTLSEAAIVWAAAQTEPTTARLVLVGPTWRELLEVFARTLVVDGADLGVPVVVPDHAAVVPAVAALLATPRVVPGARG